MAALTTSTSARGWAPDLSAIPANDAVPDSLVLLTSTVAGDVEGDAPAVTVAFVDDAPAGFVAEGAAIAEAQPPLSECRVFTGKVAQLLRLSREQFVQDNAAQLLSTSVSRAVTKAANVAYIAQAAPTAPALTPPPGLVNIPGVLTGTVGGSLDGLIDLAAEIADNGGTATHVVLSPTAWASIRKVKTWTDSAVSLLGTGTDDAAPFLLGLPVLVSGAVPANTGLLIDRTAVMSAVGPVLVAQSEHVFFSADSVAVRCTWRFGANVVHPTRLAKFTIAAGA
jgi:HK97 family phage major capsid protein